MAKKLLDPADASIWVHQFIKTMRAADGEVLRNAHLLGFFRRICKLLFNHIRPVFVFDGGTPALKKRTTIARRRQREKQGVKLRKAAEKLLLAHLKKRALDTFQAEQAIGAQRKTPKKGKKDTPALPISEPVPQLPESIDLTADPNDAEQLSREVKAMIAGLPLPSTDSSGVLSGQRNGDPGAGPSRSSHPAFSGNDDNIAEEEEEEEEMDASDLHMMQAIEAADSGRRFGPSFEEELLNPPSSRQDRQGGRMLRGGKRRSVARNHASGVGPSRFAAAAAAAKAAPTPGPRNLPPGAGIDADDSDDDDDDDDTADEEADFIVSAGNIDSLDPAVLSTLPPSMQLDIMTKFREQKTYINREGFQQRQAQPQSFSSFQMEEYLKGSAIRKEMDRVKDVMNAAVTTEGTTSKRIAGDAGREYIFQKDPALGGGVARTLGSHDLKQEGSGSGKLGSIGRGKPPLPPKRSDSQGLGGTGQHGSHGILPSAPELALGVDPAASGSSGLQISVDLKELAGDADGKDEGDEWEDVDGLKPSSQETPLSGGKLSSPGDIDVTKKPSNWRERMMQRQKFWSHSTGFKFGRKLADWGKDNESGQEGKPEGAEGGKWTPEEAEVQRAIVLSLKDMGEDAAELLEGDTGEERKQYFDSEDAEVQNAVRLSMQQIPGANGGGTEGLINDNDWVDVDMGNTSSSRPNAVPLSNGSELPGRTGKAQPEMQKLPDVRMQLAEEAPKSAVAASILREAFLEPSKQLARKPIISPFKEKPAQQDAAAVDKSGISTRAPPAARKKLVLPAVPVHKKKASQEAAGRSKAAKKSSKQTAEPAEDVTSLNLDLGRGSIEASQSKAQSNSLLLKGKTAVASKQREDGLQLTRVPDHANQSAGQNESEQEESAKPHADKAEDVQKAIALNVAVKDSIVGLGNPVSQKAAAADDEAAILDGQPAAKDAHLPALLALPEPDSEADGQPGVAKANSDPMSRSVPYQPNGQAQQAQAQGLSPKDCVDTLLRNRSQLPQQALMQIAIDENDGLEPVPDSSILSPDPGPNPRVNARAQAAPQPAPDLQPISDSTVLHPGQGVMPRSSAGPGRALDPGPLAGDDGDDDDPMLLNDFELGMGSQESDRLDSDALATMPSDLAARVEAHRNDQGALVEVPSDLAKQIEDHKKETKRLAKEHRKQAGITDTPTSDMYGECQELLQMFGLPYIIAPVEAEAQCAWLDQNGLVDGVVTDDNDVFLFGGQHIYRHIFADKQYVEEYRAQDFLSELGLDRTKLIHLALLLGSDYTEGISGIGIVNAVEVVHAFGGIEGLKAFKQWVMTPDREVLEAAQNVRRKGRKPKAKQGNGTEGSQEPEEEGGGKGKQDEEPFPTRTFKENHRGARKSWDVPNDFPNWRVVNAYLEAKVDDSKEGVTFARPDLEHLRRFCNEKFGWAYSKTDELLTPVLKAYDERQTQATMDSFLTFSQRFAKIKSKRLQKAVSAIRGTKNHDILLEEGEEDRVSQPKKKRARKQNGLPAPNTDAGVLAEVDDDLKLSQEDMALLDAISPPPRGEPAPATRARGQRSGGRGSRGQGRRKGGSAADNALARKNVRQPRTRGKSRAAKRKASAALFASSGSSSSSDGKQDGGLPSDTAVEPKHLRARKQSVSHAGQEGEGSEAKDNALKDAEEGGEEWEDVI